MESRLSIMGLYQFDNTIFNAMVMPDNIDKQLVIDNILLECAELEVVFPSPSFMSLALGIWTRTNLKRWIKLLETEDFEYNPLDNYDRSEEWTDQSNTTGSNSATANTSSEAETNASNNDVTVDSRTGYNADAFNNAEQSENNGSSNGTSSGSSETSSAGSSQSESVSIHSGRVHGNIGVMSTMDLIKQQREVLEYNFINMVVKEFKQRFCIMIY